jgi:predicted DNA-binding protein YlxM (UPF0122 family)
MNCVEGTKVPISSCCFAYFVIDQHTGDEICQQCGLTYPYIFIPADHLNTMEIAAPANGGAELTGHERELKEVCAKLSLSDEICRSAIKLFQSEPPRQRSSRTFAAYCLYETCLQAGVPRSMKELAGIFEVTVQGISKWIKKERSNSIVKPSDLATRACARMEIADFSVVEAIKKEADRLFEHELGSVAPQTALAVAIAFTVDNISHTTIARQCQVAKQTLVRHIRRIKERRNHFPPSVLIQPSNSIPPPPPPSPQHASQEESRPSDCAIPSSCC